MFDIILQYSAFNLLQFFIELGKNMYKMFILLNLLVLDKFLVVKDFIETAYV